MDMEQHFRTKIKKHRKDRGLSQGEMSKEIGLSQEFISHLETGRKSPSLDTVQKFCRYFELSPKGLLGPKAQ
jgi:DNA-binding XRE family transcriptional regulator